MVQDLPAETASLEEQSGQPIRILQASEIENNLEDVLDHVLDIDH